MQNAVLIISHAHAAHSLYDACLSWLLLPTFTIDEHITLFLAQINTHITKITEQSTQSLQTIRMH